MAGYALDEFNEALPEMEAAFSEDWKIGSRTYPAIAIEKLSVSAKIMLGGEIVEADTEIYVSDSVYESSAVKEGNKISARGQALRVIKITSDGDASKTLVCGPAQLDIWRG